MVSRLVVSGVCLNLLVSPKPFDIRLALHQDRPLRAFLWSFRMLIIRGGNLRECSGFRVRVSVAWSNGLGGRYHFYASRLCLSALEVGRALSSMRAGKLCSSLVWNQQVSPDFMVRDCGALAQLRAVFE
ncbi:hypothetical protein Bca52824_014744 [Brassica carinata]|uniref:Uncharacterized protein n=1 Tax=Brassica carinata TaxID=52824 RepID=A0A8X7W0W1_BRACI|nr:hypothetical protein Bca52824_014744 [Brassica carinata]